jgi:hypothetical protein
VAAPAKDLEEALLGIAEEPEVVKTLSFDRREFPAQGMEVGQEALEVFSRSGHVDRMDEPIRKLSVGQLRLVRFPALVQLSPKRASQHVGEPLGGAPFAQ